MMQAVDSTNAGLDGFEQDFIEGTNAAITDMENGINQQLFAPIHDFLDNISNVTNTELIQLRDWLKNGLQMPALNPTIDSMYACWHGFYLGKFDTVVEHIGMLRINVSRVPADLFTINSTHLL